MLLKLFVELLDLLEDSVAAGLVTLLGLADGVELRLELLLALAVGRVLVVRLGEVELSLAGVLAMVSTARQALLFACDAATRRLVGIRATVRM